MPSGAVIDASLFPSIELRTGRELDVVGGLVSVRRSMWGAVEKSEDELRETKGRPCKGEREGSTSGHSSN